MSVTERQALEPPARSGPAAIWETTGVTEHMGGLRATQRLLDLCEVGQGQTFIDIGCGTGSTARYLALAHRARVAALDVSRRSTDKARRYTAVQGLSESVAVVQADAQELPFAAATFDVAMLESVAAFCDLERLAAEVRRVLKPGGAFPANELTLLAPPSEALEKLLTGSLGIRARQEADWRDAWTRAGFAAVTSEVHRLSLRERFADHLRKEGLAGYPSAAVRALGDQRIRQVFMNRALLRTARRFLPLVGYGLYCGRKAETPVSLPDGIPQKR